MDQSGKLRAHYARYISRLAGVKNPAVERAFATVPREAFVGPAPWHVFVTTDRAYLATPDDDLAFIYTDNLIALDPAKGINNGQPSLHAHCLDALAIVPGETILHIGAGTGYYSAILAQLTGPAGQVHAYEIDPALGARAQRNLAPWPWAEVHMRSGTAPELPRADVIYVNAGAPEPHAAWLDALRPGGRLLFPLQPGRETGGMLRLKKPLHGERWSARILLLAHFIPCEDVPRAGEQGTALGAAFARGDWTQVKYFYRNDTPGTACWCRGDGWWLATEP
jgi:protein-L-isoaspartate(D-aspartate) O-methyltransferase